MAGTGDRQGLSRRHLGKLGGAGLLMSSLPLASKANAQAVFPDHPIRLVVPFAPGGAVDIVGRILAQQLSDQFGQQVYVDNRSGAGGSTGSNFVAKAAPDGYTLLLHTVSSAVINAFIYSHLPYDPLRDLIPITEVAQSPTLIVINAQVPAKTVQEFVALVKSKPGQFKFGSTGVGTSVHLDGQLFATREGLKMIHVPYRGEGDAIKDLVAGETQMETGVATAFLPFIKAGQLRALCVNADKRTPLLPDVPTAAEAGLTNFNLPNWYAIYAPRNLPTPIVQRIYAATAKVLKMPDVAQKFSSLGLEIVSADPAATASYVTHQLQFWEPIIKASGIKLNI